MHGSDRVTFSWREGAETVWWQEALRTQHPVFSVPCDHVHTDCSCGHTANRTVDVAVRGTALPNSDHIHTDCSYGQCYRAQLLAPWQVHSLLSRCSPLFRQYGTEQCVMILGLSGNTSSSCGRSTRYRMLLTPCWRHVSFLSITDILNVTILPQQLSIKEKFNAGKHISKIIIIILKPFYYQLMHIMLKNRELLKHSKITLQHVSVYIETIFRELKSVLG